MQQIKFKKFSQDNIWKLSKREFGQYRKMYELHITYADFINHLNGLYIYYLNELGISVNIDGSPVEKELAQYMWAQLEKKFNNEPLYVWMSRRGKGKFGNISIGTRIIFDKEIANNYQKWK